MGIRKLLASLDDFFDQSKKKQKKKREKLSKLVLSLENKKAELKKSIKKESKKRKNSKETYNLCKEFKALSKMLKKARKQENILDDNSE